MSKKIIFTGKQIDFLTTSLDISNVNDAADRFAELMVLEKVDPIHITVVIDKIIKRLENKK